MPDIYDDRIKNDPLARFVMGRCRFIIPGSIMLVILIAAFSLRANTFWLPHWVGDQAQYLALALKLEKYGLSKFNLKGVDIEMGSIDSANKVRYAYPAIAADPESPGTLLRSLQLAGISYYDQPLFHKPPGFPFALYIAHRLFSGKEPRYTAILTNLGPGLNVYRPGDFPGYQFYACIVPLLFSMGSVVAAFFIGKLAFSERAGLYAAAIYAMHPISVMTSQKLWADDMAAFFVSAAVVFYLLFIRKGYGVLAFVSGVLCGLGVLAKQTAGYMVYAVLAMSVIRYAAGMTGIRGALKAVFNKENALFIAGVAAVSGFWFLKVYRVFGDPLFQPGQADILDADSSGWFKELSSLPPGYILFPAGLTYLCPLIGFGFMSFKKFISECAEALSGRTGGYGVIFLWLIVMSFFYVLRFDREYRLMLPVLPLFCALAGYAISKYLIDGRLLDGLSFCRSRLDREVIVIGLFLLCLAWSAPIGIRTGIYNEVLLKAPF